MRLTMIYHSKILNMLLAMQANKPIHVSLTIHAGSNKLQRLFLTRDVFEAAFVLGASAVMQQGINAHFFGQAVQ